jgi:pyridoxamine 5'-phosphate oxidase family protein
VTTDIFTPAELAYLHSQRLGRLASVDSGGAPQNNPVGFFVDEATGDVFIGGTQLGASRKFRNVRRNPNVALVVDDLASLDPWTVRGVEIRGTADAEEGVDPPMKGMSREMIRVRPAWIGSWGVDADDPGFQSRRIDR